MGGGVRGVHYQGEVIGEEFLESLPRGSAAGIPCILDNHLCPNYVGRPGNGW